ncbi:hypothetical protein [Mesorhizobium humile]|uniref:Uncharacterized protein n=1 Tax=Mesorhizobium humile TaxID=3072313 RepID=A0ABU4YK15_9HYPH|nr:MULTISPECIES: hypothetical protein [unclassified Mesorhizobium]MDX8460315.1 hypothetical protein [Mesorhizobium sp. VK2D]MDX8487292.1 hypothetical protein [Mesorhizobium sp. VK2B]
MILVDLYLFCSHLARGYNQLKNNQYLDLFYFCLTRAGTNRNRRSRRDIVSGRPNRERLQGDPGKLRAIPGKVRSGFPSGIAQKQDLERFGDSVKR